MGNWTILTVVAHHQSIIRDHLYCKDTLWLISRNVTFVPWFYRYFWGQKAQQAIDFEVWQKCSRCCQTEVVGVEAWHWNRWVSFAATNSEMAPRIGRFVVGVDMQICQKTRSLLSNEFQLWIGRGCEGQCGNVVTFGRYQRSRISYLMSNIRGFTHTCYPLSDIWDSIFIPSIQSITFLCICIYIM